VGQRKLADDNRLGNEPDQWPANSSWCTHIPDLSGTQE
jgi:hypothetical protein